MIQTALCACLIMQKNCGVGEPVICPPLDNPLGCHCKTFLSSIFLLVCCVAHVPVLNVFPLALVFY